MSQRLQDASFVRHSPDPGTLRRRSSFGSEGVPQTTMFGKHHPFAAGWLTALCHFPKQPPGGLLPRHFPGLGLEPPSLERTDAVWGMPVGPALSCTDGETEAQGQEEASWSYRLVKWRSLPHDTPNHGTDTRFRRNHGSAPSPRGRQPPADPGPGVEPNPAPWFLAVFSWHLKTVTRGQEVSKEGLKGPGPEAVPK